MRGKLSPRDSIINIIIEHPGIHFRGIQRKSGLAVGQLEYHLFQLEKDDKISIRVDGNLKRYFSSENGTYLERQMLFYLRSNISRDILQKLSKSEYIPLQALLKTSRPKLERRKKVIEELQNDGIIEIFKNLGMTQVRIREKTKLIEIARKYRESILQSLSQNFLSLIDDDI